MEVIYDAFEIHIPISPPLPIELSPTPPMPEVPAPRKLLILQFPPAQKLIKQKSIRKKKKSNDYISTPKREGIEQTFPGRIFLKI